MNNTNDGDSDEVALLKQAVESNRDQYGELSELWRHLDTKAQGELKHLGKVESRSVAGLPAKVRFLGV
jgi:hypothetical protein